MIHVDATLCTTCSKNIQLAITFIMTHMDVLFDTHPKRTAGLEHPHPKTNLKEHGFCRHDIK
jgi:hypothetical protein